MPTKKERHHKNKASHWGGLLTLLALWGVIGFQYYILSDALHSLPLDYRSDQPLVASLMDNDQAYQIALIVLAVATLWQAVMIVKSWLTKPESSEALLKNFGYQSQKMEAMRRLSGGLAHGFNNILAAINGYAEFLQEDLKDRPSEQKFAKKIIAATKQARGLTDQILIFSRRNDIGMSKVDLIDAIKSKMERFSAQSGGSVDVSFTQDIDAAPIYASESQIEKALANIISNAIDEMVVGQSEGHNAIAGQSNLSIQVAKANLSHFDKAGMLIDVQPASGSMPAIHFDETMPTDQSKLIMGQLNRHKDYVCVSIADTGFGMSRSVLEYAFEPFFTTKPMNKGTGLGLSVVQGVMVQHDGAIAIHSRMGQGTKVSLYFPLFEEKTTLASSDFPFKKGSSDDIRVTDQDHTPSRILLVEDQRTVREVAEKMLTRLGYDVVTALNGRHALEIIERYQSRWPFDLVYTDHAMPQMDGLELAEHCAEIYPDLKFIIASGYSREKMHDIIKLYPSVKAVLRKPVGRETMKKEIEQAFAQPSPHGKKLEGNSNDNNDKSAQDHYYEPSENAS